MNDSRWANVPCNVCGADQSAVLHPSTLQALPSYRVTDHQIGCHPALVRCQQCGLVYANPQPADLAALYERCEGDPLYEGETAGRLRTFAWLLSRLQKQVAGGRLLDVGCSVGLLLVAAREQGWQVCGLEPSAWAARQAALAHEIPVTQGTLADAPPSYQDFDAITLVDVLEHLADPATELARARRLLRPGGVILISTPDISAAAARFLGERWWGMLPTHLWYFDRRALRRLLEQSGFRILEIARARRSFSLDYWANKLNSYSPHLGRVVSWALRVSGLGSQSFWLDLGDQLLVIARKEEA
jgi:predicted Zn finger-like uncharacterized protein